MLTLLFTNPEGLSVKDVWKPAFDNSSKWLHPPSLIISSVTPGRYWTFNLRSPNHSPQPIGLANPGRDDWQWKASGCLHGLEYRYRSGQLHFARILYGALVWPLMRGTTNWVSPQIWETPFSVTNASFPCSVDRIHGPLATEDHTYLINHSLNTDIFPPEGVIVSDPFDAQTTNGIPSFVVMVLYSKFSSFFKAFIQDHVPRKWVSLTRLEQKSAIYPSRFHKYRRGI